MTQRGEPLAISQALNRPRAKLGLDLTAWMANYRNRVLKPLAEQLGIEKLNFQILRRTMATQAQKMGSVKDIQAHLRHARPDTTANEYMQALPESVQRMVGSVYQMLTKGEERAAA